MGTGTKKLPEVGPQGRDGKLPLSVPASLTSLLVTFLLLANYTTLNELVNGMRNVANLEDTVTSKSSMPAFFSSRSKPDNIEPIQGGHGRFRINGIF
jgi:hypothetical protein